LRLLRVIRSLNPAGGGPVEGLHQITPHLNKFGIDTSVATLDDPSSSWLHDLPYPIHALGPVHSGYGFAANLPNRIRQLARSYDVVIIEGIWQYHSLATYRALSSLHIPYFVYTHGMLDPWFKRSYPLKHLKKTLYWILAEYHVLHHSHGVLFTTTVERDLARQSFPSLNAREIVVGYGASSFPPPSSTECQAYFNLFPELIDKEIFLFLGRIHPKKGVNLLISAFAHVASRDKHKHLVLAGPCSESYRYQLQTQIHSLSVHDQITWTGHLRGSMKSAAFSTASLFCLPSHQENFGVSVAEALSVGIPVAISTSVNISDRIASSPAGLVYPDTLQGTIKALESWSALGPSQRTSMSRRASELFKAEFDWCHVSMRLAQLLNASTSDSSNPAPLNLYKV